MFDVLFGAFIALIITLIIAVVYAIRSSRTLVRSVPIGDLYVHTGTDCECLPEILLLQRHQYEIHRDLRDEDLLTLMF